MFSTKLTRVAHRAPPTVVLNNSTSTVTAHFSAPCVAERRQHQRRHSSSKASYPPNSAAGNGKSASPAKDAPVTPATPVSSSISGNAAPPRTKRAYKARKPRAASMSKVENHFAGLPSVENTKGWRYNDFAMSSFFSLHRPLALIVPLPRPSSADEFASIFESRHDAWHNGNSAEGRPEDVVYALNPLFQDTTASELGNQEGASWTDSQEGIISLEDAKHLDGLTNAKSFDDVMARFQHMPFRAPPPPQPFVGDKPVSKKRSAKEREAFKEQTMKVLNGLKTAERTFQTLLTMTEATSQDGQKFYIAERGPIVELPNAEAEALEEQGTSRTRSQSSRLRSRRQNMTCQALPNRSRQQAQGSRVFVQTVTQRWIRKSPTKRPEMVFISVKRQRKLKMKKHKYKKLMKKTRTLRRKLDRQ